MQRKEHFRGIIWPRQAVTENTTNFRYVVGGMLVIDKPLEGLDPNQTVLDGTLGLFEGENGFAEEGSSW
jgi:hypothetical protein